MVTKEDYRKVLVNSIKTVTDITEESICRDIGELIEAIKANCWLFKQLYELDNNCKVGSDNDLERR